MADFSSVFKTIFKADTTAHKRAVKDLRGTEKKAAKARLDEVEKQNEKLESQIGTLGKVAIGVGAVTAAVVAGSKAFDFYADRQQKAVAAGASNIHGLIRASRGLLTETQALGLAAELQSSSFGATQKQMEIVARQYAVLVGKGKDATEVLKTLTEAGVEANAEGLKKLGINIKTTSDTAQGFADIMSDLDRRNRDAGESFEIVGHDVKVAGVQMQDAFDDLKEAVGELAAEATPAIVALTKVIALATEYIDLITFKDLRGSLGGGERGSTKAMRRALREGPGKNFVDMARENLTRNEAELKANQAAKLAQQKMQEAQAKARQDLEAARRKGPRKTKSAKLGPAPGAQAGQGLGNMARALAAQIDDLEKRLAEAEQAHKDEVVDAIRGSEEAVASGQAAFDSPDSFTDPGKLASTRNNRGQSFLEGIFGPTSEFDGYRRAFESLNTGVMAAFDAWITGADGVGVAFKAAIGEALRSNAVQMLGESVKHAAMAVGSLAFYNLDAAGRHAAAAGKFAAGAVVMGTLAKQLGAGGASAGIGSAAGVAAPAGGGGGGGARTQGTSATIFIGSDFADEDRRTRAARMERAIRNSEATAQPGRENVSFS